MLTRYVGLTIEYTDVAELPIGDIPVGTRAIMADDTGKKQFDGSGWIDGWSHYIDSWIQPALDNKLNSDSSDTMNGSLTVTGSVSVSGAASVIRLTNTDHAYVWGSDPDGGNGWYFGRGSGGTKAVTCANYHGSTFQLPEGGGLVLDGNDVLHEGNTIVESLGIADAGKGIRLDQNGQIDASMISASTFYYVGEFTPAAGAEYPDETGQTHGAFWVVQGLGSGVEYEFTTGDLLGKLISDGDFMVWGSAGWSIMRGEMNPTLYYKLDGSHPLTHPFQAGSQQLKAIADGTDATDAASKGQLDTGVGSRVATSGDIMTGPLTLQNKIAVKSFLADGTTEVKLIKVDDANNLEVGDVAAKTVLKGSSLVTRVGTSPTEYTVWHSGNLTPYNDDWIQPALDGKAPTSHSHNTIYRYSDRGYNPVVGEGFLVKLSTVIGSGEMAMFSVKLEINNYSGERPTVITVQGYVYQVDSIIGAEGTAIGVAKPDVHVFYNDADGGLPYLWVEALHANSTLTVESPLGNTAIISNGALPTYTVGSLISVLYASNEGHGHSNYGGWQSRGSGVATGFSMIKIAEVSNTLEDAWELKCILTHKEVETNPVEYGYAEVYIQKPANFNTVTIYNKNFYYKGGYGIYYVEVRDLVTHYEIWLDLVSTTDIESYDVYSNYSNQPGSITVLPTGVEVTDVTPVELGDIYIPYLYAHNQRDSWYGSLSGNASTASALIGSGAEYDMLPDDASYRGQLVHACDTDVQSDYWTDPTHPTDTGGYKTIMFMKSFESTDLAVKGMSALVFDRENLGQINLWQANYEDEVWVDKGRLAFTSHNHDTRYLRKDVDDTTPFSLTAENFIIAGSSPSHHMPSTGSVLTLTFDSTNGELKLTQSDGSDVATSLDGRYEYNLGLGSAGQVLATDAAGTSKEWITIPGGVTDHPSLTGRDTVDSHPTSAITGLDSALASKVDDAQVLTDVPAGALFTDTIYNDDWIQPALDGKVDDAQVLTDVPAGALFTDTIYDDTTIQAEVDLNTAKISYTDAALVAQHTTDIASNASAIGGKENSLGLGTAGQVLATNAAADGKEWITIPGGGMIERGRVEFGAIDLTDSDFLAPTDPASPTEAEIIAAVRVLDAHVEEGQLAEEYVYNWTNLNALFQTHAQPHFRVIKVVSSMIRIEENYYADPSANRVRTFYNWIDPAAFIDSGWKSYSFTGHTHPYEPVVPVGAAGQVWATKADLSGKEWITIPSGVTDHGALSGLDDDDHTQYLLVDGSRAMTGNLNIIKGDYNLQFRDNEINSIGVLNSLFLNYETGGSIILGQAGNRQDSIQFNSDETSQVGGSFIVRTTDSADPVHEFNSDGNIGLGGSAESGKPIKAYSAIDCAFTPTTDDHLTNKLYVDTALAAKEAEIQALISRIEALENN